MQSATSTTMQMQPPRLSMPSVNLENMAPSFSVKGAPQQYAPQQAVQPGAPLATRTPSSTQWSSAPKLTPAYPDISPRSQGTQSTRVPLEEAGMIFSPGSARTIRMSSDASLGTSAPGNASAARLDQRMSPSSQSGSSLQISGAGGGGSSSLLSQFPSTPQQLQQPMIGMGVQRRTFPTSTGNDKKTEARDDPIMEAIPSSGSAALAVRPNLGMTRHTSEFSETQTSLSGGQVQTRELRNFRNLIMRLGLKYSIRVSQAGELTQALEREGYRSIEDLRQLPEALEKRLSIPPRMANEMRAAADSSGGSLVAKKSAPNTEIVALDDSDGDDTIFPQPGDLRQRRFPAWVTPFDGSPERQAVTDVAGGFPRPLRAYTPRHPPAVARSRSGSLTRTPREDVSLERHRLRHERARSKQDEGRQLEDSLLRGRAVRSYSSDTLPDLQRAWRQTTRYQRGGSVVIPVASGSLRVLSGMARPKMCKEVCSEVSATVLSESSGNSRTRERSSSSSRRFKDLHGLSDEPPQSARRQRAPEELRLVDTVAPLGGSRFPCLNSQLSG